MRKFCQISSLLFLFLFCLISGLSAQEAEYGKASYYGDEFHGSETASGQQYDKNALTAAHKTLPMGSRVRVTRMDNKKFVDVRINDRGPYIKGRIIDLSGKAADALGIRKDGTSQVKLDILNKKGGTSTSSNTTKKKTKTAPIPSYDDVVSRPATKTKNTTSSASKKKTTTTASKKKPTATKEKEVFTARGSSATSKAKTSTTYTPKADRISDEEDFDVVMPKDFSEYGVFKIELKRPKYAGYGVQVASLTNYANVMKQVSALQGKWFKNILVSIEKGANNQPKYKVILGPFPDQETAESYKRHAKKKAVKGFVVSLEDIE